MTTSQLKQDIDALQELKKTRGWALLQETIKNEIVNAAYLLADNKLLNIDQINFQRGAMWAARRLQDLPDNLLQKLTTDLLIEESHQAAQTKQENQNG